MVYFKKSLVATLLIAMIAISSLHSTKHDAMVANAYYKSGMNPGVQMRLE